MQVATDKRLSLIVPMLNEAEALPELLAQLSGFSARGCEVVLVDGGSTDGCDALAIQAGFTVLIAQRGRARQMNAGAAYASGDIFLFLHADTHLPDQADSLILDALRSSRAGWGRFDVQITGQSAWLPFIAAMINLRSRLSGIATGDQAVFVQRELFDQVGGFPDQPLMEDIELCSRLKWVAAPVCLREKVTTSGRRWERRGVLRTVLLMWRLRLAYFLGVPAEQLARVYR
jgi:rSAM/selenodomain-associated transferase 2